MDSAEGTAVPLVGGRLLAAISTRIVAICREHYGRGATHVKTYAMDDILLVVMRGSGLTPFERTLLDSGDAARVLAIRDEFHHLAADRYKEAVEELTGRQVVAFLPQAHLDPDVTVEMFVLDAPLSIEPNAQGGPANGADV